MTRAARMSEATELPIFDRRAAERISSLATTIDGHALSFTNLDRVLYPETGTTKGDVVAYYLAIADKILPYLRDRALTVGRFPSGVDGRGFAQSEIPGRPSWIRAVPLVIARTGATKLHTIVDERAALGWLAQMGTIELHTFGGVAGDLATPTSVLFDLDPTPPAGLRDAARVACILHEWLEARGLRSFAKTSGSLGLHVVVPLNTPVTYATTRAFAERAARELAAAHPMLVSADLARAGRSGKVLVDARQNAERLTSVLPWSLRAADRPTVSTPLTWEEVRNGELVHTAFEVVARADPFAPVLTIQQEIASALA